MDPNTPQPQIPAPNNSPDLFSSPSLPNFSDIPSKPPKDKKTKLLVIASIVLVVIVVIGLIGVLLGPKNESPNAVQQIPTFNATSETVTLSEQFLKYLEEDKLDEAVAMIQPEGAPNRSEFEKQVLTIDYIKENYSTAGCQTNGSTSGNTVIVYTCKNTGGKEVNVQITARSVNGKAVLSGVSIINETSNS